VLCAGKKTNLIYFPCQGAHDSNRIAEEKPEAKRAYHRQKTQNYVDKKRAAEAEKAKSEKQKSKTAKPKTAKTA